MGRASTTQAQRPEMADVKPLLLIEVEMGGVTLYWSTKDHVYKYGSSRRHYEGRILSVSGIGEQSAFNALSNPKVTLQLQNEPYRGYAYLSQINDDTEFQRATVSIYESLRFEDDEVFTDLEAGRTLKWKGVVERFYDLDTRAKTFKLDLCSRLQSLKNRTGLSRVTSTQYPYADKSAIGQWRNLPVGDIDMVPCKLVSTGAVDTLFADMGTTAITTLIISGATKVAWLASGTFQIEDEQFTYTGYSASTKTFSGVTRARNGTTAAAHTKGTSVFQVLTEFLYEASCVPVDGITDVLVDNVRQAQGTTLQVYTGRPGSELTGYPGLAMVRFTVKPTVKKQVNVQVETEHAHTTAEGSHGHGTTAITNVPRLGVSTSLVTGRVENPDNCRDGDDSTAAHLVSSYSYMGQAYMSLNLNNGANLGTIVAVVVKITFSASTYAGGTAIIAYGSTGVTGGTNGWNMAKGSRTYVLPASAGWGSTLNFTCYGGTSGSSADLYIYEASVEISYIPTVSTAPASGVLASRSGSTVIGGDSLADVVIGKEVVVALTGVRDSTECTGLASGALTGTAGLLIERPDHVFKYFLCSRMGIPVADIGSSFDVAGAWYASAGYAFAFLTQDISSNDAQRLIQELAVQCRSIIWEWGGKFELAVLPNFDPGTYDFEIEAADVVQGPVFGYQTLTETANKIMCLFRKDYRSNKETGASVSGPIRSEAADQGFMDYLEAGWGPQDLDETIRLTAIRESATAQAYLEWRLLRKKLPEKTIALTCGWRETLVEPGMVFRYQDAVEGDSNYLVTNYQRDERNRTIKIDGILLPAWNADDSVSETVSDTPSITQTHVIVAQDSYSETVADNVPALCFPIAQDSVSITVSDTPNIVQTHVIVAQDSYSDTVADNGPLGIAWEHDATEDLQPVTSTGVSGWWDEDPTDLQPRNIIAGTDTFWEADESGDLMPEAA